jgi:hypothetical protein
MHAEGFQRGRTRAMLPKTDFPNKLLYKFELKEEEEKEELEQKKRNTSS